MTHTGDVKRPTREEKESTCNDILNRLIDRFSPYDVIEILLYTTASFMISRVGIKTTSAMLRDFADNLENDKLTETDVDIEQ